MKKDENIADEIADIVYGYLTKKNAVDILPLVIKSLQEKSGLTSALISIPRELKQTEKVKITKLVKELTEGKAKSFIFDLDESLIDGVKITFADSIWDFSLSGQVKKI